MAEEDGGGAAATAAAAVLGGRQGDPLSTCSPSQQPSPPPPLSGGEFLLQLLQRSHRQAHTSSSPVVPSPPPGYAAPSASFGGGGGSDHVVPAVAAIGPSQPYPRSATGISENNDRTHHNFPDAVRLPTLTAPPPPRTGPPGFSQPPWASPTPALPPSGFYPQTSHRPFFQAETQLLRSFPGNPSHVQHPQQHWNGLSAGSALQFGSITNYGNLLGNNNHHSPQNQVHGNRPNAQSSFIGCAPELEVGLGSRSNIGFGRPPESRWMHHPEAQPGMREASDLHHDHGRRGRTHPGQQQQRAPFSWPGPVESGRPLVLPHKPKDLGHHAPVGNKRPDGKGIMEMRADHQDREKPFLSYAKDEILQRHSSSSTQLEYPGPSLGNNTHLAPTPHVKEYQVDLEYGNINERHVTDVQGAEKMNDKAADVFPHTMLATKEQNSIAEQLVDTLVVADDDTDRKVASVVNGLRGKDYRSDFSRGQQVLSQRMRIRRRQLQCRRDIVRLTPYFLPIYESLIPTAEEKARQKQLLLTLENLVKQEWPNANLYIYGSCANSFGVSNSDIDICLEIDDVDMSKSEILLKLADILQSGNLQNVQALTRARVPIVKLMDPTTEISCDICINNLLAVVNTKLLRDYAEIDDRLRQLAFIVKHWAKSRGVNETYQGTLSSYAYVLMCIHFLQLCRPAILPCLQEMEATYVVTVDDIECAFFDQVEKLHGFGSQNKESIAELVWAFFNYWAYHHDYTNDVISVRTGRILSKQIKDWTRRIGNDRHLICIEDPFEISHDLGRVVDKYTIKILREEFERAAVIMQYDPNPSIRLFEPYVRCSDPD